MSLNETSGAATRYPFDALIQFSQQLMMKAGMPQDKAHSVADVLVRGDGFGMNTHGLTLLPPYLRDIASGGMRVEGEPEVIRDFAACLTLDGKKLPGPWLVQNAVREGMARAERYGTAVISIQNSHHAACLSCYLQEATDNGFAIFIALTDPGHRSVAPFGGTSPVLTSNPIAFGAPTSGQPILIDMSTSMITNGAASRKLKTGEQFDWPVLQDAQGNPSTDPAVLTTNPPGTILPLGGVEAGHKGYAIGLMTEVLSGCLSGRGRAEKRDGWSASITITLYAPGALAGTDTYLRQVDALVNACHDSPPKPGVKEVLIPGERGLRSLAQSKKEGVILPEWLVKTFEEMAQAQGLTFPAAC